MSGLIYFIRTKVKGLTTFNKIIFAFLLVIIIPMSMSSYLSLVTTDEIVEGQVGLDTQASVQLVSASIDQIMDRMLSAAIEIDYDVMIKNMLTNELLELDMTNPENILKKFENQNRFDNFMENIVFNTVGVRTYVTVVIKTGKRFTNYNSWGKSQKEYFSPYTDDYIETFGDSTEWIGIENNYIDGEIAEYPYVITLKRSITGSLSNERLGILVLSVPEKEISHILQQKSDDSIRLLIDENKRVIASTEEALIGEKYDFSKPSSDKDAGYMIDGQKNIMAYSALRKNGWILVETRPYSQVAGELKAIRTKMLLTNAFFVLIFLITAFAIARGIAMPIKKLSGSMLNFGQKDTAEIKSQIKGDEVRILENSFEIMKEKIYQMIDDNKRKEKMKREAELVALQAQVRPHFLFNTLNSIRCAAVNGNNEKAADMVLALSHLLKMTLVRGDELISLKEEIEILKHYVKIMQMRYFKEFEVFYNIDDAFNGYLIPKLLLQPLIENAVIHGFDGLEEGGIIKVSAFHAKDLFKVRIEDNGKGMDLKSDKDDTTNRTHKFSGIGISNVDERIKLHYGEKFGLRIESSPGTGTLVEIILPIDKLDKEMFNDALSNRE